VRREYGHVDDAAWRTGRAAVLRALLDRQHLFAPSLGLDDWEARARANLTAELATLDAAISGGGSPAGRGAP
jgi:predicted metal-dependent HD superfamily phosphohydrolase